ncbi:MAG: hypothetical protein KAS32_02190, partial [Candidatus Peribacteraceae bacterium]|nr:hypothetical protein [Candidatus Peribacteraceae bacterium]
MNQTELNIFVNADIYNSVSCIHDSRLGYQVNWAENNNLNGFDLYSGITSVTTWDGVYFAVSNNSTCYIGPSSTLSVDGSLYSMVKLSLRLDPGHHVVLPTKGKIQFQTSSEETWSVDKAVEFDLSVDNAYHEYLIDMSLEKKWSGTVSKIRIYPFIDGTAGIKIHLRYVKIEGRSVFSCASHLSGAVCDQSYRYEHPCPWIGGPGSSVSSALEGSIIIQEGVNDKLLINIDGYGEQGVTLRSSVGETAQNIARDIQDKLNLVGVGGYAFARCYIQDKKLHIDSDWFDASSSVVITEPDESSAGVILGFFDASGNKIASESYGTESASRYERAPMQLNSSAVRRLKNSDKNVTGQGSFAIDGTSFNPQGGNSNYRNVIQDKKLTFRDKTLIDYDNPITSNGILTSVGYSGDAYSNTEFRIYRQLITGSMVLVGSVDMSVSPASLGKIFEAVVSIQVKKGDLLSLYSAALHLGSDFQREDYSYILVDYKLESGGGMWELSGSGNTGLPLFARGSRRTDEAVLVVDFDEVQSLESIYVTADEEDVVEEINLCTVRNGGLGGGPHITGSTGVGDDGGPPKEMESLDALVDGEKQNINTISSYCYPGWVDLGSVDQIEYNYTSFEITFDFAKGVDVYFPVYKIVHYFVDEQNIKSFRWEVPTATNPSDTERIWGVGWSSYGSVNTDLGLMDSTSIYLYNNPSIVVASDYQVAHTHLGYKYLELILNSSFDTRSLRYNATLEGADTENINEDAYAYFPIAPSPKIQEIEIYTKSVPSKNISESFYFESSKEGIDYHTHYDTDILSSTSARYTIGRPIRSLKIHIESTNTLKVFDIRGILSEDPVSFETNYKDVVALNPSKSTPDSAVEVVTITNDSEDTSNFYIDIFGAGTHNERCLLWNKMVNDDALAQSEIGPGGIVRRRDIRYLRPYDYAYKCPGFFLDKSFFFGSPSYISRDNKSSWLNVGSLITDGSDTTYITNENVLFHQYPYVYVAIDLGSNYDIDTVSLFDGGSTGFSSTIMYSILDTDDPSSIPPGSGDPNGWLLSSKSNARWVLLQAPAVSLGGPGIRHVTRMEIDVVYSSRVNRDKGIWKSANGNLTNGISGGTESGEEEGWIINSQADYFCVDLGWWHNVTNVITGPMGTAALSIEDVDSIVSGVWPSIVGSTGAGADVAYSKSSTESPSEVVWGNFGDVPDNPVRWVMVKTDAYRVEEIIVHTDNNEQNDKISFLNKVWFTSGFNSVYNEYAHTKSGICAIALDYPSNAEQQKEYILMNQSFGVDEELSKRDALSFWFYVSDVSQLDFTYGYFKIGRALIESNGPKDLK